MTHKKKKTFREFIDKKTRETKRQLGIVQKILEQHGFVVTDYLKESDPYIFVRSSEKRLSFDGVRVYKVGKCMAFRVQKESQTHPYGEPYSLDVEEMYNDLISEDKYDEERAGKAVIKAVVAEIKNFFAKSAEAEKENDADKADGVDDPLSRVALKVTGTDYATQVSSKAFSRIP